MYLLKMNMKLHYYRKCPNGIGLDQKHQNYFKMKNTKQYG